MDTHFFLARIFRFAQVIYIILKQLLYWISIYELDLGCKQSWEIQAFKPYKSTQWGMRRIAAKAWIYLFFQVQSFKQLKLLACEVTASPRCRMVQNHGMCASCSIMFNPFWVSVKSMDLSTNWGFVESAPTQLRKKWNFKPQEFCTLGLGRLSTTVYTEDHWSMLECLIFYRDVFFPSELQKCKHA